MQEVEFIREVYYLNWLANVVMIKKANGRWRMCVDFTDLNKACPENSYSLLWIDVLVTTKSSLTRLIRRKLHSSPAKAFFVTK